MAILDSLPGIEVTVCVDGRPLREYNGPEGENIFEGPRGLDEKLEVAQHQGSVTVNKFVKSAAGKHYTIDCAVKDSYKYERACDCIAFDVYVDGKSVASPLIQKNLEKQNRVVEGLVLGSGKTKIQRLKFVQIATTQDDTKLRVGEPTTNARSMGEIKILVFRKMILKRKEESRATAQSTAQTKISEKALKGQAKSHATQFGQQETLSSSLKLRYWDTAFCGGGIDYPIAIFQFRYGSKEDLISLGVIGRAPVPAPASEQEPEAKLELQVKSEPQEAATSGNPTPAPLQLPTATPSVAPPMMSPNLILQNLDPAQAGQLFGRFLQFLQTQGGGQLTQVQTPAPSSVGTVITATPVPSSSAGGNSGIPSATRGPPIKREREENENGDRKRRRKPKPKVVIDLTKDDDDIINLDSD